MRQLGSILAAGLLAAACQGAAPTDAGPAPAEDDAPRTEAASPAPSADTPPHAAATDDWRARITPGDANKLARLDEAWRMARAEAEAAGFAAEVEALGPLVDPQAGLGDRLQPAPGIYRCRTLKIGSQGQVGLGFIAYPFFRCVVELTPGGDLILTKTTGSQRTRGRLYPDTDRRLVFIGAQALSSQETSWPDYGDLPVRDQVGVFERVGRDRYRLAIPWPTTEAKLELLELVR